MKDNIKENIKWQMKHARILGEYIGTLDGILSFWDIPKDLRPKLEKVLIELREYSDGVNPSPPHSPEQ